MANRWCLISGCSRRNCFSAESDYRNYSGRSSDSPDFLTPSRHATSVTVAVVPENAMHNTHRDYSYGDSSRFTRDSLLMKIRRWRTSTGTGCKIKD